MLRTITIGAAAMAAGGFARRAAAQNWEPQTGCFDDWCNNDANPWGSVGPPAPHGGNQTLPRRDTFGQVTGYTDCDNGPFQDPAGNGNGRGAAPSGLTDSDWGTYADVGGCGRSGR